MDPFPKHSPDPKPPNKYSSSKSRYHEQSEQDFIPKCFISSRASKNSAKQVTVNIDMPKIQAIPNEVNKKVMRKIDDGREYGPTMPPEFFNNKEEFKAWDEDEDNEEKKNVFGNDKNFDVACRDQTGEDFGIDKKIRGEENDEGKIVDIQNEDDKVDLNTHQIKLKLNSFRYASKKNEKTNPELQPLFSNILSTQDMERIKKVKEFVKSKDTPKQKVITLEMMPFKDDPIKNKRCFNFLCEMEGLEIGGVSAARLMTASEIRKEREEFTEFYQYWKNSLKSSPSQTDSSELQIKSLEPGSKDPSLPLKRQHFQSSQMSTKKFIRHN